MTAISEVRKSTRPPLTASGKNPDLQFQGLLETAQSILVKAGFAGRVRVSITFNPGEERRKYKHTIEFAGEIKLSEEAKFWQTAEKILRLAVKNNIKSVGLVTAPIYDTTRSFVPAAPVDGTLAITPYL